MKNSPVSDELLARLYRQHYGLWMRNVVDILYTDEADDLIQETFTKLLSKVDKLESMPEYGRLAYIAKSVRNRALQEYNRKKNVVVSDWLEQVNVLDETKNPALIMEKEADRMIFYHALESLTEREQFLLIGRYYGNMTDAELADEIGLQPASIRSAMSRAREKMKKLMAREGRTHG